MPVFFARINAPLCPPTYQPSIRIAGTLGNTEFYLGWEVEFPRNSSEFER
jgi:hypothetical protein